MITVFSCGINFQDFSRNTSRECQMREHCPNPTLVLSSWLRSQDFCLCLFHPFSYFCLLFFFFFCKCLCWKASTILISLPCNKDFILLYFSLFLSISLKCEFIKFMFAEIWISFRHLLGSQDHFFRLSRFYIMSEATLNLVLAEFLTWRWCTELQPKTIYGWRSCICKWTAN